MPASLPVFVYGTLRPGSWNHDGWLAPWLAAPCRPAVLEGYALHRHGGLPYVLASPGDSVEGELAVLSGDEAIAALDVLEGVDAGHYERVTATLAGGEQAWVWVAGPLVAGRLGPSTKVRHGDWLRVG